MPKIRPDYRKRLAALGFTDLEVNAVILVLLRIGLSVPGVDQRPKFVHCVRLDPDGQITDMQFDKALQEAGFFESSIMVIRYALGGAE